VREGDGGDAAGRVEVAAVGEEKGTGTFFAQTAREKRACPPLAEGSRWSRQREIRVDPAGERAATTGVSVAERMEEERDERRRRVEWAR
jgi:hypothetical protein